MGAEAADQQIAFCNMIVKYGFRASERSRSQNVGEAPFTHLLSGSVCCRWLCGIVFFEADTGVKL